MLEKPLTLDFHHMCKEATSAFSSLSLAPFHFKTRGRVFRNGERMMIDKIKGRKPICRILGNIPKYRKLYILIIFVAILS